MLVLGFSFHGGSVFIMFFLFLENNIQSFSLELVVRAFVIHKMCSEDLSYFSCCPQRIWIDLLI